MTARLRLRRVNIRTERTKRTFEHEQKACIVKARIFGVLQHLVLALFEIMRESEI